MNCLVVVVACLLGAVMADEAAHIHCNYPTPMDNFNLDQFMGKWYWTLETPNVFHGRGDRCPVSVLQARENGTIAYILKYIYTGATAFTTKEGNTWHCSSCKTDGAMMVQMPTNYGYWEARWWILGTDYTNWAATYGCWFSPDGAYRSWNMGWCREKNCSEENRNAIKNAFEQHSTDNNELENLDYSTCPDA